LELSETLNYTRAAERLYISQPVLTKRIQLLENELNLRLFERNSKGVMLTDAGKILAGGLRELTVGYRKVMQSARDAEKGFIGEIKVGMLAGMILEEFYSLFREYEQLHNNIRFTMSAIRLHELGPLLHDGKLDLIVGAEGCIKPYPELCGCPVAKKRLCLYFSDKCLDLGSECPPGLRDFRDKPFIAFPIRNSDVHRKLMKMCMDEGFSPRLETFPEGNPSFDTILLHIGMGHSVAILHEDNIMDNMASFHRITLDGLPSATFCVGWNDSSPKLFVREFISFVKRRTGAAPTP